MKKKVCFFILFFAVLLLSDALAVRNVAEPDSVANVNDIRKSQNGEVITITVEGVSFDMVLVAQGIFFMGCTTEQEGECYDNEKPMHQVAITNAFYIGKYEVTQELYEAVMGVNPSHWKGPNLPVESVSWDDAQLFCKELSRLTGYTFTLPTEAEWEYAARGGNKFTGAIYSGGYAINKLAWYSDNSGDQTHPVGQLRPNELGIYDMSGNVWEWCQDWYGNYDGGFQTDPKGPLTASDRVLRGGCWLSDARHCRVSYRIHYSPAGRFDNYGFRIVLR